MIKVNTHLGAIELSGGYLSNLIAHACSSCFGVVRMDPAKPSQGVKSAVLKSNPADQGVRVRPGEGPKEIIIDLHLTLSYGVNVTAVTDSIRNKVRFAVERETGLTAAKVNVFVDGMENS